MWASELCPRSPHLAVFRCFERSKEQGEAEKTEELSKNRRFFDKQQRPAFAGRCDSDFTY